MNHEILWDFEIKSPGQMASFNLQEETIISACGLNIQEDHRVRGKKNNISETC